MIANIDFFYEIILTIILRVLIKDAIYIKNWCEELLFSFIIFYE